MKMPYLLILLGVLLIATGIYLLARPGNASTTVDPNEENRRKGQAFEEFVIRQIMQVPGTTLVGKNSDYHKDGISAEENRQPDLRFRRLERRFSVECKWRARWHQGRVQWARQDQIVYYQQFARAQQQPVLVALGIGGQPSAPAEWYLVPLEKLTWGTATKEHVREYRQ